MRSKSTSRGCYTVPQPWKLSLNNRIWQVVETSLEEESKKEGRERSVQTLYFYGAYYDDRVATETPVVRLLAMSARWGNPEFF